MSVRYKRHREQHLRAILFCFLMPVFIIMSTIIKVDTLTPHLFFSKAVLTTRRYALHLRIRILANLFAYQNIQKLKTEYCTLTFLYT